MAAVRGGVWCVVVLCCWVEWSIKIIVIREADLSKKFSSIFIGAFLIRPIKNTFPLKKR